MSSALDDYVQRVEETCGKAGDFIAIIRYDKAADFLEKALKSGEVIYNVPGIMAKIKINDKEISVLRTGRVLVKGASNLNEVKYVLEKIVNI